MPEIKSLSRLAAVLLLAAAGCGGTRRLPAAGDPGGPPGAVAVPAAPVPPAIVAAYPALAQLPTRPTWTVAVRAVAPAVGVARDLVDIATLAVPTDLGARPEQIDEAWRRTVGASPLRADGLGALGIDVTASAAAFGGGDHLAGVALPVADRAIASAAIARLRPPNVPAAEDASREWATWEFGSGLHVAYWLDDRWLVAWLGAGAPPAAAPDPIGWEVATDALDAADARARAVAGDERLGFGWLDSSRLAADADNPTCAAGAAAVLPTVTMAAAEGQGQWRVDLEVEVAQPGLVDQLAAPAPPPGFSGYRDTSGADLEIGLRLGDLAGRLRGMGCAALAADLAVAARQLRAAAGAYAVRAAVEHATTDAARLRGAAWLGVTDPAPLRRALARVPGFLQRTRSVGGYRVRVIDVPMVPFLAYVDRQREFVVAAGEGVVERVLAAPPSPPRRIALAGVGVRPDRFRDPREAIRTIVSLATLPGVSPAELDRRLRGLFARFRSVTARATPAESGVRVRLRGEARPPRPRASL